MSSAVEPRGAGEQLRGIDEVRERRSRGPRPRGRASGAPAPPPRAGGGRGGCGSAPAPAGARRRARSSRGPRGRTRGPGSTSTSPTCQQQITRSRPRLLEVDRAHAVQGSAPKIPGHERIPPGLPEPRSPVDDPHLRGPFHGREVQRALPAATSRRVRPACRSRFDLPTQTGYRRRPRAGEGARWARSGVPIAPQGRHAHPCSTGSPLDEMNTFDDDQRHRGPWLLAPLHRPPPRTTASRAPDLQGTTQNDILKEYLSRRGPTRFPRPGPRCG